MTRVSPPAHINRFIIPRDLSVTPVPFFNLSWIISMTLRLWISGYKSGNLLTESLYSSWTLRQFEIDHAPLIKYLLSYCSWEIKKNEHNRVIALGTSCKILNRQQTWIWVKSMIIMPKKCMFDYKIKNWYYVYIHNITNKH